MVGYWYVYIAFGPGLGDVKHHIGSNFVITVPGGAIHYGLVVLVMVVNDRWWGLGKC